MKLIESNKAKNRSVRRHYKMLLKKLRTISKLVRRSCRRGLFQCDVQVQQNLSDELKDILEKKGYKVTERLSFTDGMHFTIYWGD